MKETPADTLKVPVVSLTTKVSMMLPMAEGRTSVWLTHYGPLTFPEASPQGLGKCFPCPLGEFTAVQPWDVALEDLAHLMSKMPV